VQLYELQSRLRQLSATFVPEKSDSKKHLYWSKKNQFWVLVTVNSGMAKLAFFPMERCPCEDE